MTYQRAIGNQRVDAISTGDTTHRGTFARRAATKDLVSAVLAVGHWRGEGMALVESAA